MTTDIPFGDPIVDVQLGKLIDDAMREAFIVARGQRRQTLSKGFAKTRDGAGLDEFSFACGRVSAFRDLAAVIAPGVLEGRDFDSRSAREAGRLAADAEVGLTADKAHPSDSGGGVA